MTDDRDRDRRLCELEARFRRAGLPLLAEDVRAAYLVLLERRREPVPAGRR